MAARYYSAAEAARRLGISRATLYAYVSRGMIRSEPGGDRSRARRYPAEDVDRLLQRKEQRRDPASAVARALHWGAPVLDSALTTIDGGRLFYRGYDVETLARERSAEEVASLLWTDSLEGGDLFEQEVAWPRVEGFEGGGPGEHPVVRFQAALPLAAAEDWAAYNLQADEIARAGARILRLFASLISGARGRNGSLAGELQRTWLAGVPEAEGWFNAALILCADHELNVSSFTARCVASAGATPYGVVAAGLAALRGRRHGGYTERVEALLREVGSPRRCRDVLAERLRRGEDIPGFGHRLYPDGDPRGRVLLALAAAARPDSAALALALSVADAAAEMIGQRPTVDFGLATLARVLALPDGAALTLFAMGRTIGWIGHALEQYALNQLIRPRARYVGRPPGIDPASGQ